MKTFLNSKISLAMAVMLIGLGWACEKKKSAESAAPTNTKTASTANANGLVKIDGSSTVFPLTEAVAEEFQKENRDIRVTVGFSGTGGGMKKLIANEIDLSGASRPIKESEIAQAKANGIDYKEIKIAYDGIAIMVNKDNSFVNELTTSQLKAIWEPNSKIQTWADLNPAWPKEPIKLYGPGPDSGTFDYFTETITGEEKAVRSDFTASEDDNVLVHGIAGDKYALGYFGFAYYQENADSLKLVPIRSDEKAPAIIPSHESIADGTYKPLSRPIFIYLNQKSWGKPEVKRFVNYYLDHAGELATEVGYVGLETSLYETQRKELQP
ncbi:MAG: PstS family phosphate ABC transporter substrate-binding protein [Bdellovibrionota bacterium]